MMKENGDDGIEGFDGEGTSIDDIKKMLEKRIKMLLDFANNN